MQETEVDEEPTLHVKYMNAEEAFEQPLHGIRSMKDGNEPEDTFLLPNFGDHSTMCGIYTS